jgi:hypothetical protein
LQPEIVVERAAAISRCGRYRWWLRRKWSAGPAVLWVMLNPARADAARDDPTIKRVIHFSRSWGFGAATVVNLYPFRSTQPAECRAWVASDRAALSRIRRNDKAIAELAGDMAAVVVAWGSVPWAKARAADVATKLARIGVPPPYCLGTTADGSPLHPMARGRLRIADDRAPIVWHSEPGC